MIEGLDDRNQSPIYLWVDRYDEISLLNYGKRLVLEFFVPEPGAYLAHQYRFNTDTKPPEEFKQTAAQINETNYLLLAHQYVAGVTPPPEKRIIVGATFPKAGEDASGGDNNNGNNNGNNKVDEAGFIKIPEGYYPKYVYISVGHEYPGFYLNAFVTIAGQTLLNGLYPSGFTTDPLAADFGYVTDQTGKGLPYTIQCNAGDKKIRVLSV